MDTPQFNVQGSSSSNISSSSLPQQPSHPNSAAPQPPSSSSAFLPPGLPEHVPYNYKGRLQSFTQKSNIPLPVYVNVNEGLRHNPKFRATVWVDGMKYTSPNTFSQQKAAEFDVARIALENLHIKFKTEGCPVIHENTTFSKSILYEYAAKLKVEMPTYNTVQLEGLLPLFVSSVTFKGTTYVGDAARSKKDAEQLAARNAIMSILDGATSGLLYEIIKSKYRLFGAVRPTKSECMDAISASSATMEKDKEVAVPVAADSNETKVALPARSTTPSFNLECQMPEHVPSLQATVTELPNLNLLPGPEQSTADGSGELSIGDGSGELSVGDGSSSKKRKRTNKSKANKKSRSE